MGLARAGDENFRQSRLHPQGGGALHPGSRHGFGARRWRRRGQRLLELPGGRRWWQQRRFQAAPDHEQPGDRVRLVGVQRTKEHGQRAEGFQAQAFQGRGRSDDAPHQSRPRDPCQEGDHVHDGWIVQEGLLGRPRRLSAGFRVGDFCMDRQVRRLHRKGGGHGRRRPVRQDGAPRKGTPGHDHQSRSREARRILVIFQIATANQPKCASQQPGL
mmetsp:Transcript_16895/g.39023  ORF Transcript_16895/g.39023 Transcript_16895/m.39023 type:complete len:215 (-) Transcript_16895:186-830(-)